MKIYDGLLDFLAAVSRLTTLATYYVRRTIARARSAVQLLLMKAPTIHNEKSTGNSYLDALLLLAREAAVDHEWRRTIWRDLIRKSTSIVHHSPRENSHETNMLRRVTMEILLFCAQAYYGPDDKKHIIHTVPACPDDCLRPVVAPVTNEKDTIAVALSIAVRTWEDAFYELAHECVHLLNPMMGKSAEQGVATLDEGVAVYFAESLYFKYITTYTRRASPLSPISVNTDQARQYTRAYVAAAKLSHAELRHIREVVGGFPYARDPRLLGDLAAGKLTDSDTELLTSLFDYTVN